MTQDTKKNPPPKSILIALSDAEHSKTVSAVLKDEYGVESIAAVGDGEAAWAILKEGPIEFVVLDWKIPKISGLILFNRLRQDERYRHTPIMVVSDLVQKENFILLKDYPLTGLADGDFSLKAFLLKYELLLNEYRWFEQNNTALDSIAAGLREDPIKTKKEFAELLKSAPNPIPILNLGAQKYCELGAPDEAELLLQQTLKIDDRNSTATMMLAKIYHASGKHKEATALIQKNKFSLKNVERLLLLGEINLADKKPDEARVIFANALNIDAQNATAKAGILVADNMKHFLVKNDVNTLPKSFASLLNLVAVALVKSGQQEEGIQQYKAALAFIHDGPSQAKLMFNLGLGYLRWSKKNDALEWFQKSAKLGGSDFKKSGDYLAKLSNKDLALEEAEEFEPEGSPLNKKSA